MAVKMVDAERAGKTTGGSLLVLLEHGGCHHVRPQVGWYAVKAAHVDYLHPLRCCLIMILLDGAQYPRHLPCMITG